MVLQLSVDIDCSLGDVGMYVFLVLGGVFNGWKGVENVRVVFEWIFLQISR